MNLFADLLASTQAAQGQVTATGPRIQKRRGVEIKSAREVKIMRQASHIVATVLREVMGMVEPGQTTGDIDAYAEKRIREMGATPSFKGYHGFPASICASINNEVVHGIPSPKRVIRQGDLLKVDTGAYFEGYHGDSCITICVGDAPQEAQTLSRVAKEALMAGLSQVKAGNTLLDIAGAVEDHVKANGFSVVEDYTGHGVGRNLHEEPSVFNFRTDELPNVTLRPGMTLAIEPILNAGSKACRTLRDQWTVVTRDGSLSAQWEHTVLVTSDGCEILTDRGD
ncbi:MAG: type I methionyl aminopeptidase [Cyanobacteria bacterium MAG STY4_bin_9]|jgi:methionyl aminopeptidase|uniref:type I methionyl aminopeptidase n=1 Tax=unclassified Synechococcus TaxID=2626047 RepID=UPI00014A6C5D|nr:MULTISPECIES: type I methionyl aminopeptidase [unclassified Synechococcus]MBN89950.1 type I methionyl aminopeptidase [Synechococcus sp. RS344]MBR76245.1 type I methionyl aminopeptidase [Cyanobium sp. RS427]MCH1545697.1 type I methionyl aminopeptidase [Synechococcus sp. MOX_bin32]MCY3847520.1 type I methionyl aminopeptidase [Cyanobacteria bacterium MAG COS4_bin_21]MDD9803637.1 type I methionyl aminopeptidase [Cyanobacteria bacterium MAG STY1_bin_7]MDD9861094.1 type I methionyl aminopeptidas|tara:strand:+ start:654 stop:1499 length:846 start_codon:yes stop_codon:yes gene_type:complete